MRTGKNRGGADGKRAGPIPGIRKGKQMDRDEVAAFRAELQHLWHKGATMEDCKKRFADRVPPKTTERHWKAMKAARRVSPKLLQEREDKRFSQLGARGDDYWTEAGRKRQEGAAEEARKDHDAYLRVVDREVKLGIGRDDAGVTVNVGAADPAPLIVAVSPDFEYVAPDAADGETGARAGQS